jgi:hypothetical protein
MMAKQAALDKPIRPPPYQILIDVFSEECDKTTRLGTGAVSLDQYLERAGLRPIK